MILVKCNLRMLLLIAVLTTPVVIMLIELPGHTTEHYASHQTVYLVIRLTH